MKVICQTFLLWGSFYIATAYDYQDDHHGRDTGHDTQGGGGASIQDIYTKWYGAENFYVPEEKFVVDSYYYGGALDSMKARCDITPDVKSTADLQHAFTAGGGGSGWSYTSLILMLNPGEGTATPVTVPKQVAVSGHEHWP